jgi:N-sulfoglucosamine sulfohydrolase
LVGLAPLDAPYSRFRNKNECDPRPADPDEVRNPAGDPQYAPVLAELKAKLAAFQKRTGDPWQVKWERE